jgi:hypothetical protein
VGTEVEDIRDGVRWRGEDLGMEWPWGGERGGPGREGTVGRVGAGVRELKKSRWRGKADRAALTGGGIGLARLVSVCIVEGVGVRLIA